MDIMEKGGLFNSICFSSYHYAQKIDLARLFGRIDLTQDDNSKLRVGTASRLNDQFDNLDGLIIGLMTDLVGLNQLDDSDGFIRLDHSDRLAYLYDSG